MHPFLIPSDEDLEPTIDPLAFMLEPVSNRDAMHDRSAGRVLEVAQVFGDSILDIKHYGRADAVRLGETADFYIPSDMLPSGSHVLFHWEDGAWVAEIAPNWAGFIDRGDERSSMRDRMGSGTRLRLEDDEVLVLDLGPTLFVARSVWKSRKLVGAGQEIDPTLLSLASLVGVLAALAGMIGANLPAPPQLSHMEMISRIIDVSLTQPKPPVPTAAKKAGPASGGGDQGDKRSINKEPPKGDTLKHAGVLDVFDDAELKSVLGDASLPSDLMAGIDGLIGKSATTGPGVNGFAGRCAGHDCTGFGSSTGEGIGDDLTHHGKDFGQSGGTWTKGPRGEISAIPEEGIMIGQIDRSLVDAVVKRHLREIKYCYQRELQKVPTLSGKVTVKFVIAGDGSVSSATTKTSTLGNSAAEACINSRFSHMQFPALKAGGIAIVSYPFLFAPG